MDENTNVNSNEEKIESPEVVDQRAEETSENIAAEAKTESATTPENTESTSPEEASTEANPDEVRG